VDYEDGKEPFNNQSIVNKIRAALREQVSLMDEDGKFGKYQGYCANVKVKLSKIDCGEE